MKNDIHSVDVTLNKMKFHFSSTCHEYIFNHKHYDMNCKVWFMIFMSSFLKAWKYHLIIFHSDWILFNVFSFGFLLLLYSLGKLYDFYHKIYYTLGFLSLHLNVCVYLDLVEVAIYISNMHKNGPMPLFQFKVKYFLN